MTAFWNEDPAYQYLGDDDARDNINVTGGQTNRVNDLDSSVAGMFKAEDMPNGFTQSSYSTFSGRHFHQPGYIDVTKTPGGSGISGLPWDEQQ